MAQAGLAPQGAWLEINLSDALMPCRTPNLCCRAGEGVAAGGRGLQVFPFFGDIIPSPEEQQDSGLLGWSAFSSGRRICVSATKQLSLEAFGMCKAIGPNGIGVPGSALGAMGTGI